MFGERMTNAGRALVENSCTETTCLGFTDHDASQKVNVPGAFLTKVLPRYVTFPYTAPWVAILPAIYRSASWGAPKSPCECFRTAFWGLPESALESAWEIGSAPGSAPGSAFPWEE